jgi:dihydroxyacetone kinase phosphoprotein-dependent L subunit
MRSDIDAHRLVLRIIEAVEENRAWLSEIDGAVGDGDHGINMAKGLSMVRDGLKDQPSDLSEVLRYTGMTLVTNIGGAMGPIYGTFFMSMSKAVQQKKRLEARDLLNMLSQALEGVKKRGGAEVGDKTLIDTLAAAASACEEAVGSGKDLGEAIDAAVEGAKAGMESTRDMVARKGRSSRLGERSRGTIDAGAASCYIILKAMGESIREHL